MRCRREASGRLWGRVAHALIDVSFELGEVVDEQLHQLVCGAVVLFLVGPGRARIQDRAVDAFDRHRHVEAEVRVLAELGAPFMPRHPSVYGNLLKERIAKGSVQCWLLNTGWTGGKYGVGKRMPIKATRALLNAALDGSLNGAEFRKDPNFGFDVPVAVEGVDSAILDPRATWADKEEYDRTAQKLVQLFVDNFAQFEAHVDQGVRDAAPQAA